MENYYYLRKILFNPLAWILSKRELHKLMKLAGSDVDKIIFQSGRYVGRGFYASLHSTQMPEEIHLLGELVQQFQPRTIVEIGTKKGGTFFLWCRSNPKTELFVSIDLPGGEYGGGYVQYKERLYQEFIYDLPNAKMELLRVDSHNPSTLESLTAILKKQNIDFLFIDGDHTYEGVKKDVEMYLPLVQHGLVAFHDIKNNKGYGVPIVWEELKKRYPTQEFIQQGSTMGIGVVYVGGVEELISNGKSELLRV